MSELGNCWMSHGYHGYAWVTVCLLLLCLPPSFTAIVFPNDVLSSLDKYKTGHDHHHSGRTPVAAKPTVPISSPSAFPSLSSSDDSQDDKLRPPLDETAFDASNHHHAVFPSVPQPSSTEAEGSFTEGFLTEDFFQTPHEFSHPALPGRMQEEDGEGEDYDYSDYPEIPPRPQNAASSMNGADSRHEQTVDHAAASVSKPLTHHHQHQQYNPESSATSDSSKHKSDLSARMPGNFEETNEVAKGGDRHHPAKNYNDPSLVENTPGNEKPTHHQHNHHQHSTNTKEQHYHQQQQNQNHDQQQTQRKEEVPKHCPRCHLREADRLHRIETLKRKILDRLHFTTLPNRTGMPVPRVLSHMSDIRVDLLQDAPYGANSHDYLDDEEDEEYTAPERVFTTAKELPSYMNSKEENSCFFSIPNEVLQLRVTEAYLWFYVRDKGKNAPPAIVQMRVSRLGPPSKKQRSSKRVIWTHKDYSDKASGWKRVDVTNVVRRWAKHPSSNYGLEILAMRGEENLAVLPLVPDEFQGYEPTLDIKVTKEAKRRYRRSDSLTCAENTTEHRCCRYPLSVSFAEFGWDWVIAPTHVNAHYCAGECHMTLQNKTPYSWVASQTSEVGGSCCTPSKMSSLPLMYFDQNGAVIYQILQNMKVDRCGCA